MKDGYGSYKWKDGRRYIGEWKDNKRHGKGCIKDREGDERYGVWENDKRVRWEEDTEASRREERGKGK